MRQLLPFYGSPKYCTFLCHSCFSCSDGECVDISVLCDYHVDCQGGEDENCGELV